MWNWNNLKQHGWDGQCRPFCRDERGPNQRRICSWAHDPQLQVCHGLPFSLLILSHAVTVMPKLGPSRLSSYTLPPHLPSQSPLSKKQNLSQVLVSEFGLFLCYFCFLLFAFVWFKWCLSACLTILFYFCVVFCDMCSSRQRICALQTWNCLRVRTRCLLRVRKVRLFQRENSKFYNLIFLSKKRNALPALSGKLLLVSIVNKKYNFNSCFI